MKEIELSRGLTALCDDEDYEMLNQFKWCAQKGRNTFYATRYSSVANGRHRIYMHHEIISKPPTGLMTDHRNGCGTDNQKENLRHVTRRQNGQNQSDYKKSSQYPGVHWDKEEKKWRAQITIDRKKKHLGRFTDEKAAFGAYKNAVNKLGEKIIGE